MKRPVVSLFMIFIAVLSLSAVTLSSSVLSAQGDVRFADGFYPINGKFSYEASLPDYLDSIASSLTLNFDAGLKHRLLVQNPETGEHMDSTSSPYEDEKARWYQVQYIYFSLEYEMGLVNVDYLSSPLFSLVFSLEGDYENAYERLGWLNTDGDEATFTIIEEGKRTERFSSCSGVPELKTRKLSHTGIGLGAKYRYVEETRMTKDGLWADLAVKYMPSWFPLHDKNGSSYLSVSADGGAAFTLLNVSQFSLGESSDVLRMFTLVLDTQFGMRFVTGKGIPQYALEKSLWGSHNAHTMFLVSNTTKLVFSGPQLMEDVYPTVSLLSDIAYSFGPVANSEGTMNCFSGSISLRAEADLFDTLYLYAECGWVYASVYTRDLGFRYSLGVRLGI